MLSIVHILQRKRYATAGLRVACGPSLGAAVPYTTCCRRYKSKIFSFGKTTGEYERGVSVNTKYPDGYKTHNTSQRAASLTSLRPTLRFSSCSLQPPRSDPPEIRCEFARATGVFKAASSFRLLKRALRSPKLWLPLMTAGEARLPL